jgi:putative oxidoreductase
MPPIERTLSAVLGPFTETIYAALRIVSGAALAFHGAQKVLGFMSETQPDLGSQLWIGGVIELVGGLMIALGFWTRTAAFLCSGMMAVAYSQFHWQFRFDEYFFPAINGGELALIYAFLFLFIAARGVGKCGIDRN